VSGRVRVLADTDVCIGAGMCVLADEQVFDQDDIGVVRVLVEEPEDTPSVRSAVANCPSGALRISAG
jgi:ferredoxin